MNELTTIRPENFSLTIEQIDALMPFLILLAGTLLGVFTSVWKGVQGKWATFVVTVATLAMAFVFSASRLEAPSIELFNRMLAIDGFTHVFVLIFAVAGLITSVVSFRYLDQDDIQMPEFNLMILFSCMGMALMAASLDLVITFIALEIMSLSIYTMVGFRRSDRKSNEASLKYFVLGGAASALFLYGAALMYGATGTTQIREILEWVRSAGGTNNPVFIAGFWLALVGMLFKVASVPFHMWMPDVYEGAPTPVTGFMITGVKAAAFAAFLRLFLASGYGLGLEGSTAEVIRNVLWIIAFITMFGGNLVALGQQNLKRLLAYSSIGHTGYLLIGFLSLKSGGTDSAPVIFYLISYTIMNLGAFAVLTAISQKLDKGLTLTELSGVSRRHPGMAFAFAVFIFSMAGIPPTAGFVAKYFLFYAAIQSGEIWIVIAGVLSSTIAIFYYLRVIVYMYMKEPIEGVTSRVDRMSTLSRFAMATTVALTLLWGIFPGALMEITRQAVRAMLF